MAAEEVVAVAAAVLPKVRRFSPFVSFTISKKTCGCFCLFILFCLFVFASLLVSYNFHSM